MTIFFLDNDLYVTIDEAVDQDGADITGGTAKAQIFDLDGNQIGNDIALSEPTAGNYAGTIDASIALVENKWYNAKITLEKSGLKGVWEESGPARKRDFSS